MNLHYGVNTLRACQHNVLRTTIKYFSDKFRSICMSFYSCRTYVSANSTKSLYGFLPFHLRVLLKSVFITNLLPHLKLLLNGLSGDSLTRVLGDCDAKSMSLLEDDAVPAVLLDCILILLADVTSLIQVLSSNTTVL